jgi:hypothetical protein
VADRFPRHHTVGPDLAAPVGVGTARSCDVDGRELCDRACHVSTVGLDPVQPDFDRIVRKRATLDGADPSAMIIELAGSGG